MTVSLLTFGFKYGVPYDIDLLFDVRFLKNPNFVPDLKPLTGEDPRVQSYVLDDPNAKEFLDRFESFARFLLPLYRRERRSYLTVAIGCTGGRHRSVAVAVALRNAFLGFGQEVNIRHRDLHRA